MKGPITDDVFDMLAKVDTLNLYGDPEAEIYNKNTPQAMYKLLLSQAAELGGIDAKAIELAMDKIAWHESRRDVDEIQLSHQFQTDPQGNYALDKQGNRIKMRDEEGKYIFKQGPGRGLYQYELRESDTHPDASGAARVALNRLYNWLGGTIAHVDAYGTTIEGVHVEEVLPFMEDYLPTRHGSRRASDASGNIIDIDFSQLTEMQQKVLFLADKLEEGIDFSDIGTDTAQWWLDHHKKKGTSTAAFDESMTTYKQQE